MYNTVIFKNVRNRNLLPVEEYESRIHVRSKNCHDMNFGEFLHACRLSARKDANTNVISLKYTKQE